MFCRFRLIADDVQVDDESGSSNDDIVVFESEAKKKSDSKTKPGPKKISKKSTDTKNDLQLQSKCDNLQSENARQKEDLKIVRNELKSLKAKEASCAGHTAKIKKLEAEVEKTTSQATEASSQFKSLKQQLQSIELENKQLKDKLKQRENDEKVAKQEYASLLSEHEVLKQQFPKEELTNLQAEKAMHEQVVESLKQQVIMRPQTIIIIYYVTNFGVTD